MTETLKIDPDALYDDGTLVLALGLTFKVLAAARRAGRLRYTRQGRRVLYLGSWLLAWLEDDAQAVVEKAVANE